MKKSLQILLIVCIVVCFFIFLRATDVGAGFRLIKQLGFHSVFILLTTTLAGLAGASGWKLCIDSYARPSFMRLFMIRQTGNIITLFNPSGAIAGEVFNARRLISEGVEEQEAYKSVLLARALMISSQLVLFAIVLMQFLFSLSYFLMFLPIVSAVGLAFLLLRKGKETAGGPEKNRWHKLISRAVEMRTLLAAHIRRHPKKTAGAFLLFSAQWISGSLELFFILYFLNYPVSVCDSLFLDTLIIVLKSAAAFIPGQAGVEELINKFALHLLGIPSPGLWVPVSILRRARQLFWSGMAVLFYLQLKSGRKSIKDYGDLIRQS
ncbi:MAG: flippase-like domain-containing protein [Tannerellaceae bacterium]|jgi:hypothetical protein|nr:flippase-like domain-containing protein [Tannerellaceae bacterium]